MVIFTTKPSSESVNNEPRPKKIKFLTDLHTQIICLDTRCRFFFDFGWARLSCTPGATNQGTILIQKQVQVFWTPKHQTCQWFTIRTLDTTLLLINLRNI